MDQESVWDGLIDGLQRGNQEAEHRFWHRYGAHLERIAEDKLGNKLRQRVDPEDIAQSVCRTFMRRAKKGEFQLEDSRALWRLLCAITLNKVRSQARFHNRQKRGLTQEGHLEALAGSDSSAGFDPSEDEPTAQEVLEFNDQFEHVLNSLDDEECEIVTRKLNQETNEEIASQLGCSERTVRRILNRLEQRFSRELLGE